MLKEDFFFIATISMNGTAIEATLQLNEKHKIFDGHFPGQPVVPGVCMVQMVKEVAETALGNELLLAKAGIKFLKVIHPTPNSLLQLMLKYSNKEDGTIDVDATLFENTVTCFKFKGRLLIRYFGK